MGSSVPCRAGRQVKMRRREEAEQAPATTTRHRCRSTIKSVEAFPSGWLMCEERPGPGTSAPARWEALCHSQAVTCSRVRFAPPPTYHIVLVCHSFKNYVPCHNRSCSPHCLDWAISSAGKVSILSHNRRTAEALPKATPCLGHATMLEQHIHSRPFRDMHLRYKVRVLCPQSYFARPYLALGRNLGPG